MTAVRDLLRRWRDDARGSSAVEYAFVLPVFVMLAFGLISTAQLAGAISGMHYAVEEAARCSAVNATVCGSPAATVTFAKGRYRGPAVGAVFTSTTDGCGHTVRATGSFSLEVAVASYDVPLSAAACYPGKDS